MIGHRVRRAKEQQRNTHLKELIYFMHQQRERIRAHTRTLLHQQQVAFDDLYGGQLIKREHCDDEITVEIRK